MTAKISGTNGLLQSYDYQASTTGFSYTFAAGTTNLVMNPAGTLATGTITMPAAPSDGMTITFSSSQAITALTVNANTGQSIVGAPTALLAGGSAIIIYRLSNTTWYTQVNTYQAPASGGFSNMVVLTSTNASYSIPATKIKVTVVGAGGGGGGVGGCLVRSAGGGGAGGSVVQIFSGLTISNTLNITVGTAGTAGPTTGTGAGGTGNSSSVASGTQSISTVTATGGGPGIGGNNTPGNGAGGAGGVGSGGLLNIQGGAGLWGANVDTIANMGSGSGGNSIFGGGGLGISAVNSSNVNNSSNGNTGGAYGGGGGGAQGSIAKTGGAGAAGVVIIEY
jgi:hypothetical protein